MAFQHGAVRCCHHEVVSVTYQADTLIHAASQRRNNLPSARAFRSEQPFHAIECDIGEQRGDDSSLWRAGVRGPGSTQFHDPSFEPTANYRGEDWQLRQ